MFKNIFWVFIFFSIAASSSHYSSQACSECNARHRHERRLSKNVDPSAFLVGCKGRPIYLVHSPSLNGGHAFFAPDRYFYDEHALSGACGKLITSYFPHWVKSAIKQFEWVKTSRGRYRIKSNHQEKRFLAVKPLNNSFQYAFFATEKDIEQHHYLSEFELVFSKSGDSFGLKIPGADAWFAVSAALDDDFFGWHYAFFATKEYIDSKNIDFWGSSTWNIIYLFRLREDLQKELQKQRPEKP